MPVGRLGEQVAALEQRRDRRELDGRGLLVAERRERAQEPRVERERGEAGGFGGVVGHGMMLAPRRVIARPQRDGADRLSPEIHDIGVRIRVPWRHARFPARRPAAPPPGPRRHDRGRARRGARGLRPHGPPRRRGPRRGRRPDLRGARPARRDPARGRLPDAADGHDLGRGGGAVPVRDARARRRSSGWAPSSPAPGSRSSPRSRRSCAAARPGCSSGSTSTPPAGSGPGRRSPPLEDRGVRLGRPQARDRLRPRRHARHARRWIRSGIVLKAGTWYLVASHDDQLRTYRVSRVMGAAGLPDKASAARRLRPRRVLERSRSPPTSGRRRGSR